MPDVIVNTSPLQYLFQTDLLDLLPALYGRVAVPSAVVAELAEGRGRGLTLPDPTRLAWVEIARPREPAILSLVTDLGPGEREVLALAAERPGSLVILDDNLARRHANLLGLRLTGTLGVLLKAKAAGRVALLAPVLDRLDALRFRLDPATRAAVLRLAGEAP